MMDYLVDHPVAVSCVHHCEEYTIDGFFCRLFII
jgi:hypothetical protein